jgi:hypothetical protein
MRRQRRPTTGSRTKSDAAWLLSSDSSFLRDKPESGESTMQMLGRNDMRIIPETPQGPIMVPNREMIQDRPPQLEDATKPSDDVSAPKNPSGQS